MSSIYFFGLNVQKVSAFVHNHFLLHLTDKKTSSGIDEDTIVLHNHQVKMTYNKAKKSNKISQIPVEMRK